MNILISIFILFFPFLLFADNISDFEIEGISIGDSLLDHFSKEEIIKNKRNNWYLNTDGKFMASQFYPDQKSIYEALAIHFKTNDKNFIVEGVSGGIFYKKNFKECYLKQKEIAKEISSLFQKSDWKNSEYEDSDGKYTNIYMNIESNGRISIQCFDWNSITEKEKNWTDNLRLTIKSEEFAIWLDKY